MNKLTILLNQIKSTRTFAINKYVKESDLTIDKIWKEIADKLDELIALGEDLNKLDE